MYTTASSPQFLLGRVGVKTCGWWGSLPLFLSESGVSGFNCKISVMKKVENYFSYTRGGFQYTY